MTRKTTVCATFTEKLAIKALLDERLHPVEGTNKFRYEDGWNDEITAKEVSNGRLAGNITSKIRNECFGKLHNGGKKSGRASTSVKLRVERLESQLEFLLGWMQAYGGLPGLERDAIINCVALEEETGE